MDYEGYAYNDIALIELKSVIEFNLLVYPVCILLDHSENLEEWRGHFVIASGYGPSSIKKNSLLKADEMTVFSNAKCNRKYDPEVMRPIDLAKYESSIPRGFVDYVICARHPSETTAVCGGDSGGPIVTLNDDDDRNVAIAIVHGNLIACSDRIYPNILIRLDSPRTITFIKKVIFDKKGKNANLEMFQFATKD